MLKSIGSSAGLRALGHALLFVFMIGANPARAQSSANHVTGFYPAAAGRQVYVDYQVAAPGRPTVVLLNGLTYRIGCWDQFVNALQGDGLGILRYDAYGQGETLLQYKMPAAPIPVADQVADLNALLDSLNIQVPVHLVSLSYGGAIDMLFAVQYPRRVASVVLMAPFVAPIPTQDTWVRTEILATRTMYPLNTATDDELYDYFLRLLIYQTYPTAEPIVLENQYKLEATFRMVQGVRKFLARDIVGQLPVGRVHLMVGLRDQYIDNSIHDEFWRELPEGVRASRLFIEGSEHKIPEAVPAFSAAWVKRIVAGDPELQGGHTFLGHPSTGEVTQSQ